MAKASRTAFISISRLPSNGPAGQASTRGHQGRTDRIAVATCFLLKNWRFRLACLRPQGLVLVDFARACPCGKVAHSLSRSCDALFAAYQLSASRKRAGEPMLLMNLMTGNRQNLLRFGAGVLLRRILLACALGLFASFLLTGEAQAHGVHAGIIVANASDAAGKIDAEASIFTTECEALCCDMIGCASVLVSFSQSAFGFDARSERFARPKDSRAGEFSQTSLRRPPRA